MLCTKCQKNQATHFLEKNINGKVTKLALCSECAEKSDEFKFDPFEGFGGFDLFDNMFGFPKLGRVGVRSLNEPEKKCTLCASTFEDIVNRGKVGCAECYKVFRDELEPTIRRLHGDRRYIGRGTKTAEKNAEHAAPDDNTKNNPESDKSDKIKTLKKELKEAVKNENYERAAELRDMIRAIEN